MRVLFVHDHFGALAGAESNLLHTATELKRRGHAVGILHGSATGKGEATWRETFAERFPLTETTAGGPVEAALGEFKPDVIYVHKLADLEVIEALLTTRVPLVRMVHDHDLYCMRSCKYHYFSRKICTRPLSLYCIFPCGAFLGRNGNGGLPLKWVSYSAKKKEIRLNRQFQRLIVATNYMKQELLRNRFAPEKIEIHPPVPPNPDSESGHSTFSDRNLILFAGQIIRGKGVDALLESLARVRVPFECAILGDGNHRPFCEQLSRKLGLAGRVHFHGFVPQDQIKQFYRECSVAVLSSVWPEPFGAVGLEAMRCGLPVVAFDAGGIREWLIDGFNGYLVPWMDRGAFAKRIEELLRDKARARQMGECGQRFVSERYDFSKYISALEDLFSRVVYEVRGEARIGADLREIAPAEASEGRETFSLWHLAHYRARDLSPFEIFSAPTLAWRKKMRSRAIICASD